MHLQIPWVEIHLWKTTNIRFSGDTSSNFTSSLQHGGKRTNLFFVEVKGEQEKVDFVSRWWKASCRLLICSAVLTLDFTELLCFWSWEIIIRGTAGRVNQRRTFWSEVTAWWDLVQRGGSSRGSGFFLLTVRFDVLEICATPLAPQTLLLQHPCCIIRTIPPLCWSEDYAITVWPHVSNF